MQLRQTTHIFLLYVDRHSTDKPRLYCKASQEPHQMNSRHKAIGHGSFFKHRPYDYTDDKFNLPQGHEDCNRMVDMLPADRAHCNESDNDSVLPSNWLECTGEIHPLLDLSFGTGTWKSLSMGDLKT